MGKVLTFMCKRGQEDIREAMRKLVMARLARTYYGIPNSSKRRPFDRLLGLWPRLPEPLKTELRHMMVPAFRKRTSIFKNDKLIEEMEEFIGDFERKNEKKGPII